MRISVRSPIMSSSPSQASRFSRTSEPYPNVAETAPLSPGGHPFARQAGLRAGASCMVPGCGEERIPFEGPLGVTGEEYRVAPMADDGRRRNINPLPFRP